MRRDFIADMKQAVSHIKEAQRMLGCGPLEYYFTKLVEHSTALMDRFAPLKVGQKAVIAKEVECLGAWKWRERTLAIGATGTIASVDYSEGCFWFDFVPDKEWRADRSGQLHEVHPPNRHSYCLSEHFLAAAPETTPKS